MVETLRFIQGFQRINQRSPTYPEIARGTRQKYKGSAHNMVTRLIDRNHIKKTGKVLEVLDPVPFCLSCCGGCHKLFDPQDMTWQANGEGERGENLCPGCAK